MATERDVATAFALCVRAHAEQRDKAGVCYVAHPIAVRKMVDHEPPHVRAAALLHDAIEDTDWNENFLREKGVPEDVIALVVALTRKQGQSYSDYLEQVKSAGPDAVVIKLSDLRHNMLPDRAFMAYVVDGAKVKLGMYFEAMLDLIHYLREHGRLDNYASRIQL